MSDMKLTEALNLVGQFKGIFRAFEKLEEVLTTTRKAEANNTKLRLEGEQIAGDNKRAQDAFNSLKEKIAKETVSLEEGFQSTSHQYDKKRAAIKDEFTKFVNETNHQKNGLQDLFDEKQREFSQKFEKKKAETAIKVDAMKREQVELKQSIDALRADKSRLEKEMGF